MKIKTGFIFCRSWLKIMFFILAILSCLQSATPALAFPPLPSGFYGTVKINGTSVPDGTLVRVIINGIPYAETHTLTYQGSSVFQMSVPGDDLSTTDLEGGKDGDIVHFSIANFQITQTGTWHSGTNVEFNLNSLLFLTYAPILRK
jgi:hypothetical protein